MSDRLFRWLTRLLPAETRRRYATEMEATFRRRVARARTRGAPSAALTTFREFVDLVRAATRARWGADPLEKGIAMPESATNERTRPLAGLGLDVRFAVRLLRRAPGFTLAAVLTLAIGIGANAAVFSVIYGVLLAPLPFPDAGRLVALFHATPTGARGTHSPVAIRDYEARMRAFAALGIFDQEIGVLTGHGDATRHPAALVTPGFFDALGVAPQRGRVLREVDLASPNDVVVISDGVWRSRLGGGDVVGTALRLDGELREIVGIMPAGAGFPSGADFWIPLVFGPGDLRPNQRGAHYLQAIARLRSDVDVASAQRDADRISAELAVEYPNYHAQTTMEVVPLIEAETEHASRILTVLFGAVVLVLMVACANVANLLLSRATQRHSEVALRASLGAGRMRLLRQFLVESLLVSAAGAVAGLLMAAWMLRPLLALAPDGLPRADGIGLHWPVVLFTIVVAAACGVIFGLIPALAASQRNLTIGLDSGLRTAGSGRGRLRRTLAIADVALALVLVTGALLLLRTVDNLARVEPGFDATNVWTFRLALPEASYPTPPAVLQGYDGILADFARVPGVDSTAIALGAPFSRSNPVSTFDMPGSSPAVEGQAALRVVGGAYFRSLGIPVVAGRDFDRRDAPNAPPVAIVNQAFVREFMNGVSPIGQSIDVHARLTRDAPDADRTIVGVVGDVRQRSLSNAPQPDVFVPYTQHPVNLGLVIVKASTNPDVLVNTLRARLRALDPDLPLAQPATMDALIGQSTVQQRFTGVLLAIFAGVAVLLAAVGLYGVLACDVTQRTREIGVRMALGAERGSVLRLFFREGAIVAIAGALAGVAGAWLAGGYLESLLFGITASDPLTLAAAAGVVLVLAAAASLIPARRATRLDPVQALRD